jgi:hypothetical protein
LSFHKCEHRRHLQLGRQPPKRLLDLLSRLSLQEMIGLRPYSGFCNETLLRAFAPEMVEC